MIGLVTPLCIIGLFAVLLVYWIYTAKAKNVARDSAKQLCYNKNLLLYDNSMALLKVSLQRDHNHKLQCLRLFRFEYMLCNQTRHQGHIELLGLHIQGILFNHKQEMINESTETDKIIPFRKN
jgi:hypothetical protein